MLISVFDSSWFDPAGICLKDDPNIRTEFGREYARYDRTMVIGSNWSFEIDKNPDEVAAEINKQIRESESAGGK